VRFKAGVRRFPQLVPDHREAPGAATSRLARDWWENAWTGRTLMAVGLADPVLGEAVMANLRQSIRNCPPPMLIADAGHFTQEWGGPIAEEVIRRWA
jgi:pimeloyl-ACP methyl ester carboxylesterase